MALFFCLVLSGGLSDALAAVRTVAVFGLTLRAWLCGLALRLWHRLLALHLLMHLLRGAQRRYRLCRLRLLLHGRWCCTLGLALLNGACRGHGLWALNLWLWT